MNHLKSYIRNNQNTDFNHISDCVYIIKTGMQSQYDELCLCIKECLKSDQCDYYIKSQIIKLCFQLTNEKSEQFNFGTFSKIVLPQLIQFLQINKFYSKLLEPLIQQLILSCVTLGEELLCYWAHVFPQTIDFQISQFLIEYQQYKNWLKEKSLQKKIKNQYLYIPKKYTKNYHQNYKQIKLSWKNEQDKLYNLSIQEDIESQNIESDIQLKSYTQLVEEKKKELESIYLKIDQAKLEIQRLEQQIDFLNLTINSGINPEKQIKIQGISSNNSLVKQSFDQNFNFDLDKQQIQITGNRFLYINDTSYPEKKQRLLDGRGVFHIGERYQLARNYKLNQTTIDIAIYLKCNQNTIRDLRVTIKCEGEDICQDLDNRSQLEPGQQIIFQIRDIQKSQIHQKDLKIELFIDSQDIIQEEVSFLLTLTNIVNYIQVSEKKLIKEYQEIKKALSSELFDFDYEAFPNGLQDVQKCIQHSINYKNQSRSLLIFGSINDLSFICKINLDEERKASIELKKLDFEDVIAQRLVKSYVLALQKN